MQMRPLLSRCLVRQTQQCIDFFLRWYFSILNRFNRAFLRNRYTRKEQKKQMEKSIELGLRQPWEFERAKALKVLCFDIIKMFKS